MDKKKILAFAASNSRNSINKKLAFYAANLVENTIVTFLDLNDFEMPIFSVDRESDTGIPELALKFKEEIKNTDGIIISFAEHNGAYSTAFKNIFDWVSRINKNIWENKPMLLMATSPGANGGKTVLNMAATRFRRGNISKITEFSLPSFNLNFSEELGIVDKNLNSEFEQHLNEFIQELFNLEQ